jgi:hypothetical protein
MHSNVSQEFPITFSAIAVSRIDYGLSAMDAVGSSGTPCLYIDMSSATSLVACGNSVSESHSQVRETH